MNQVWLFFCVLNLLADSACLTIHIIGSLHYEEPLPHNMIFCATFAGFMLITLIRAMRILFGLRTRLHPQLVVDASGLLMHFLCALLSLHYAENDFHLIFMGPNQELDHHFFQYCKQQSIACIIAGGLYLLQFVLVLDFIYKTPLFEDERPIKTITEPPEWDDSYQHMSIEEHDKMARTQANVYLFGRHIDHWLRVKSKWFRQLAGGQELINKSELLPVWERQTTQPEVSDIPDDDEKTIVSKKSSRNLRKPVFDEDEMPIPIIKSSKSLRKTTFDVNRDEGEDGKPIVAQQSNQAIKRATVDFDAEADQHAKDDEEKSTRRSSQTPRRATFDVNAEDSDSSSSNERSSARR